MIHTTIPIKLSYYDRPSSLCKVYFSQWGNYHPKRGTGSLLQPQWIQGYLEFQGYQVHLHRSGEISRVSVLAYGSTGLGIDLFLNKNSTFSETFLNFQLSPWFWFSLCLPSGCRKLGLLNMRPAAFIMCLELVLNLVEPVINSDKSVALGNSHQLAIYQLPFPPYILSSKRY